jgi:hypothetical protein
MTGEVRRTPEVSLGDVFRRAAADLPGEDPAGDERVSRASVVARALEHLQAGFDAHYAGAGATDEDVLVGDNSYAWAVETIARLDEPRFVAVASRMIRDGSGRIAAGDGVTIDLWTPHLADLLDIISNEGREESLKRISAARREVEGDDGAR